MMPTRAFEIVAESSVATIARRGYAPMLVGHRVDLSDFFCCASRQEFLVPHRHDLDSLCAAVRSAARLKYLFFWSHIPAHAAEVGKECLSQWYAATFVIDGLQFPTAEHYMMFRKATLFGDNEAAERILQTQNPGAAKAIGRSVRGFEESIWQQHRVAIAVDGNYAKFSQSIPLRDFLLNTQERVLVEASPVDRIWGIGLAANDPEVANPPKWRGLNLLGFALMDVRERLR